MAANPGTGLWLALANGHLLLHGSQGDRDFAPHDALTGRVAFLSPESDGTLWMATDRGLGFYDGTHFLHWDRNSGLPGDLLLWAIPDLLGHVWLGYRFGVAEIAVSDLLRQTQRLNTTVTYRLYDDGDGLRGTPEVRGAVPATRTTDGRIWFTMSDGVATIDPAHISVNRLAPLTHILKVAADGIEIPLEDHLVLKPLTRTVAFYYAGLSFSEPRKVRYRYRLASLDLAWQAEAAQRSVSYANLRPGAYRFEVQASNNDGVWDETGATVAFEISPMYYQTAGFKTFCGIMVAALCIAFYRFRVRRSAKLMQYGYETRLAERTRIARELHDNLIQEMMGVGLQLEMADEITSSDDPAKPYVSRALELAQGVIGNGRRALGQLRLQPMRLSALQATLEDTVTVSSGTKGMQVHFVNTGLEQPIAAVIGEEITQIAREAVRNALRHAAGTRVMVRTDYGTDRFSMTISDEGAGISMTRLVEDGVGHYGITGMRERARRIGAHLELSTSISGGTEWRLTIPANLGYSA